MSRRDGGFTLIEMLVSLALLGLASAMIMQGLGGGVKVWRHARDGAAAAESVESAQSLVRGRLERLRPATVFSGGQPMVDLGGDTSAFSFVALPLDSERPAAARRYTLTRTDQGELVLRWSPNEGSKSAATDQVLLRGAETLDIAYLDNQNLWRSDWLRQLAPPRAIRIRVGFPAGDRRVWPDMIVRPASTVDTLCVLDSVSGVCRGRQ